MKVETAGMVMSPRSAGVEQAPGQSRGEATRLDFGVVGREEARADAGADGVAGGGGGADERVRGGGVRGLREQASDAEHRGAGVLGLDVGDQGGVLGAERGGVEVGPDRQRRERDGDVVGELGVGARRGPAGVAAAGVTARVAADEVAEEPPLQSTVTTARYWLP